MKTPIIGIIGGNGRMGNLFSDFFMQHEIQVIISDKGTKLSNTQLAEKSDIVIVAVPINYTVQVIKEVLPNIKSGGAIMDLTSVKIQPVNEMLKGKVEVMGMHPMFGDSNPIPGQTIILCPTKKSGEWSTWMEKFLVKNGANIVKMSTKDHDKIMGTAQALIHFADIAFIDCLRKLKIPVSKLLDFTSKASTLKILLASRLIAQDPSLYAHIQTENTYSRSSIKTFVKSVQDLSRKVNKKDTKGIINEFKKSQTFLGQYKDKAYLETSKLIELIIDVKDKYEKQTPNKNDLASLGPVNTFSSIAAKRIAKKDQNIFYTNTISDVFELVENKKVASAIVPIENKLGGTVRETLDELFERNIHITQEVKIPINHCLIMLNGSNRSDIRRISSHSQALAQCEKYIKKNFPKSQLSSLQSTAQAVEQLIKTCDRQAAVIAPEIAAQNPLLKVYEKNIEDAEGNETSFYVIEKGEYKVPEAQAKKTSLAIHFSKDSPGSLAQVLNDFSKEGINLSRIESRPTKAKFGQYLFYIDLDGSTSEKKIQRALKEVSKRTSKLKILGSY